MYRERDHHRAPADRHSAGHGSRWAPAFRASTSHEQRTNGPRSGYNPSDPNSRDEAPYRSKSQRHGGYQRYSRGPRLYAFVEEEVVSLAREYCPPSPSRDDVPERGDINQEPIVLTLVNFERRFSLVSARQKSAPNSAPEFKTSKVEEKLTQKHMKPLNLHVDTEAEVLLTGRTRTPYAYKPLVAGGKTSIKDTFLSPDAGRTGGIPKSMPAESGFTNTKTDHQNRLPTNLSATHSRSAEGDDSEYLGPGRLHTDRRQSRPKEPPRGLEPNGSRRNRASSRSSTGPPAFARVESVRKAGASARPSPPTSPQPNDFGVPKDPNSRPVSRANSPQTQWDPVFGYDSDSLSSTYTLPSHKRTGSSRRGPGLAYPDGPPRSGPSGPSLPYPVDTHSFAMPEEDDFQFTSPTLHSSTTHGATSRGIPSTSGGLSVPSTSSHGRAVSASAYGRSSLQVETPPMRRTTSSSNSASFRAPAPPTPPPIELPSCPRRNYVVGHTDWYTLHGYPEFDFCPSCLDQIVRPSGFQHLFVPSEQRPDSAICCDLGDPWVRCAWLLNLKQNRADLGLIKGLGKVITSSRKCPGNKADERNWYGLKDLRGNFIEGFYVCPRDRAFMEALFPAFSGLLARQFMINAPQLCSLRAGSSRFHIYLDVLEAINESSVEAATASGGRGRERGPVVGTGDLKHLIELVETLCSLPECPRDRASPDAPWHIMPSEPSITVCPECYDAVIKPDALRGNALALGFLRTPRLLTASSSASSSRYSLAAAFRPTCQLYSARMRGIWDAAVEDGRGDAFIRKARERRHHETEIGARTEDLREMMEGIGSGFLRSGVGREDLRRELVKLEREWEAWE